MNSLLNFNPQGSEGGLCYQVTYRSNGCPLGDVYMQVDGFFVYQPPLVNRGCWSSEVLQELSIFIKELNKDWEEECNAK